MSEDSDGENNDKKICTKITAANNDADYTLLSSSLRFYVYPKRMKNTWSNKDTTWHKKKSHSSLAR